MSFRQRAVPLMLTSFVGVASGIYIFQPLLQQYALDTRGTYDPELARVSTAGGAGGGVVTTGKGSSSSGAGPGQSEGQQQTAITGDAAREKIKSLLDGGRQADRTQ